MVLISVNNLRCAGSNAQAVTGLVTLPMIRRHTFRVASVSAPPPDLVVLISPSIDTHYYINYWSYHPNASMRFNISLRTT